VIKGKSAFITLPCGRKAVIDAKDAPRCREMLWRSRVGKHTVYVTATTGNTTVQLHRFILRIDDPGHRIEVDHRDHDGLNNRRTNLRRCTRSRNGAHTRVPKRGRSKSRFRGVTFNRFSNPGNPWGAKIGVQGKRLWLGWFSNASLAARAYDAAAKRLFGQFATTNFRGDKEVKQCR
jgi:hypothetical protein